MTSPADNASVTSSPVTVTGTTAPGNAVHVAATNTDANSATTVVSTTAGGDGSFSVDVGITGGTNVLNVVAVSPSGGTAHARRTVLLDVLPGTLLLDAADPDGDDAGPGTTRIRPSPASARAPSTSSGSRSSIPATPSPSACGPATCRRRSAARSARSSSTSTRASRRGDDVHGPGAPVAQLRDRTGVRVEPADPGAGLRPALRGRGRQCTRDGDDLGESDLTPSPSASRSRPLTPGPGWGFVVVLTGQDGFSPDNARSFAPTPQEFQFGVCATASSDPHCTFDPGLVPAVDVIPTSGVLQSTEPTTRSAPCG